MNSRFIKVFIEYLIVTLQSIKIFLENFLIRRIVVYKPSLVIFYLMSLMSL